jgi:peptidyl-prolyl cis-trans isomerase D
LSIFIGIALIAFLLGDLTSASSIFQSRKNRVGVVEGNNIDYMEFASESEAMTRVIETLSGRNSLPAEEHDRVRDAVWESYVRRFSYDPGYRRLGIAVGEGEQVDMVQGLYPSPVIEMMFTSPETGRVDTDAIREFVAGLDTDATGRMSAVWEYIKTEMVNERMLAKYMALVSAATFVNDLEVAHGVKATNTTYAGRYAMVPFSTIADSLVNPTAAEVKKYYREHRENFRQTASRDLEYVVFDMSPSEADYADAAARVDEMAAEFAAAEDAMQYASLNSQERVAATWVGEGELSPELAAIAFGDRRGEMDGPTLAGDVYTMSRLAGERMLPDSVGARHILLNPMMVASADSLVGAIRGGADIAELAASYSMDPTVDLGVFAPGMMVEPFAEAVRTANRGDVFAVTTQYGTHVVEMTYRSPLTRKVQMATIVYNVEPSPATEQAAYNQARDFLAAAAGSKEKFDGAVSSTGASLRVATIGDRDREVRGLADSREIVRWSFNTKPGVVSPIFDIDGDYVVAVVGGAREAGFSTVNEVSSEIMRTLRTEAKAAQIAAMVEGKTIDEVGAMEGAAAGEFAALKFGAFYEPSIGVEPAVIGAASGLASGAVSKPIKGSSGVYVMTVAASETASEDASTESERVRLEANAETSLPQRVMQAMQEGVEMEDFRARFF